MGYDPWVAGYLPTLLGHARVLWIKAKSERASPRQIGLAVALGVLIGCSPALGLHGWIAVAAASLLRLNRLFALLGSRVSFFLLLPWITLCELEVGHRLRTGTFIALERRTIVAQAPTLLGDWFVGWIPVGVGLALVLGLLVYAVARLRAARA